MAGRSALVLLLALCGFAAPARAQAVLLDAVTRAQGSPSDYVADAIQTRDGFFWLATDAGVARYDGREFATWTAADGLPHTYANALLELPSGAVAVGTYGGAAIVERGRVRRLPGTTESVGALAADRFGRLYLAAAHRIDVCEHTDDAARTRCRPLLSARVVGTGGFTEDADGTLRLPMLDGAVAVLRPSAQGVAATREAMGPLCASGSLGFGAIGAAGLRIFSAETGSTCVAAPDGRTWTLAGRARSVLRRGDVTFVGTDQGEIWRIDPRRGSVRIAGADDTGGYSVDALLGDYEGGIWAGLFGGGLRRVDAGGIVLHARAHPALARATLRLSRDDDGTLWLTTREGLVRRGASGEVATTPRTVLALTTPAPGGGWYASSGTNLRLVDARGRSRAVLVENNWISSLLVGAGDTLWVGTYGSGVRRGVGARETAAVPGAPEIVEALAPGVGGAVWALTRSEGAARSHAGRWTAVRDGLPSGAVFSLLDETDGPDAATGGATGGALWLGTDRGLVRRRGGAQTVFDDGGRLRGQRIHALFRTHADTLWVVADRQIHALVGERLVAFGRLRLRLHDGVAVHTAVGVPGERRVFLGTSEGLVEIDLGARGDPLPPPRIAFLGRAGLGRDGVDARAVPSDTLRLANGERGVTLAFAPLTFGSDVAARVQYQMADGPWSEPTAERRLALAGLADGWHRLRVRAVNAEGRASDVPVEVAMFVPPPWWRTWPARAAALALLIGIVGAGARAATTRRLRARLAALETERRVQGERERISRDLHDHVGAQLTGVLAGLELLGDEAPGATDLVDALRGEVRDTMGALRTTLFTLQHPPDTFDDFGRLLDRYVRDQARFHPTPALRCAVEGASAAPLDAFEALHLFRIAQEGLQNALRHAGAAAVRVRLAREPGGTVVLTVADDGVFRDLGTLGAAYRRLLRKGVATLALSATAQRFRFTDTDGQTGATTLSNRSAESDLRLTLDVDRKLSRRLSAAVGAGAVRAGLDTRFFEAARPGTTFTDDLRFEDAFAFAKLYGYGQLQARSAGGRLTTTVGLRADEATILDRGVALSPRASALFALTPTVSVSAAAGQFYQTPGLLSLGVRDATGARVNRALRQIHADQIVGGLAYAPRPGVRVSVEGFYKRYARYPVSVADARVSLANLGADFGVVGAEPLAATGRGRAYGAEVFAQRRLLGRAYGILAYTLAWSEFAGADGRLRPSAWDVRHTFGATGGVRIGRGWEVSSKVRVLSGRPYTPFDPALSAREYAISGNGVPDRARLNALRAPAYARVDVRADRTWRLLGLSGVAYLDVQNVFNRANLFGFQYTEDPAFPDRNRPIENVGLLPNLGLSVEF